jgi:hypothetical protein
MIDGPSCVVREPDLFQMTTQQILQTPEVSWVVCTLPCDIAARREWETVGVSAGRWWDFPSCHSSAFQVPNGASRDS